VIYSPALNVSPPDHARLFEAFRTFFEGTPTEDDSRIVRETSDGTLLRSLEAHPDADPRALAILKQISVIPSRRSTAWAAWHLLQREVSLAHKPPRGKRTWIRLGLILLGTAGLLVAAIAMAHELGWLNAASRAEAHAFGAVDTAAGIDSTLQRQIRTRRRIEALLAKEPEDAQCVWRVLSDSGDGPLVASMLRVIDSSRAISATGTVFEWSHTAAWDSSMAALNLDRDAILDAAREMQLSPRLVALPALCEQLRRTESFRDVYKRLFGRFIPTGNLSMGVTGVKPETLRRLRRWCDPRYLPLIDSVSDDTLKKRLNESNHRWAYRYGALCLRCIRNQWMEAGVDLSARPEILLTIYNLGMNKCPPRPNPRAGGAIFRIDGVEYTFGSFAWEFYWSGRAYPELPY